MSASMTAATDYLSQYSVRPIESIVRALRGVE